MKQHPESAGSIRDLASALGIPKSTVADAVRRNGFPRRTARGWLVEAARSWFADRATRAEGSARVRAERHHWVAERDRLQAAVLALEVGRLSGKLVPREYVLDLLQTRAAAFDRLLRERPRRLASLCAGQSADAVFRILHRDTNRMVDVYRQPPFEADVDWPEDVDASAVADGDGS